MCVCVAAVLEVRSAPRAERLCSLSRDVRTDERWRGGWRSFCERERGCRCPSHSANSVRGNYQTTKLREARQPTRV